MWYYNCNFFLLFIIYGCHHHINRKVQNIYYKSRHQYLYFFLSFNTVHKYRIFWKCVEFKEVKKKEKKRETVFKLEKKNLTLLHHLHLDSYHQQTQIATTTWENSSPTFFGISPSQSYFELLHFKPKNMSEENKIHTSEIN